MNRGSIELARRLCVEIAGPTDEDDVCQGYGYGSVDVAEILSAEVVRLRAIIDAAPHAIGCSDVGLTIDSDWNATLVRVGPCKCWKASVGLTRDNA